MGYANKDLKIDKEFEKWIPPLTKEEFEQLQENCCNDGIRDPICIWNDLIIDGHNRFKISKNNGWLDFNTVDYSERFQDRHEVLTWILLNQAGRRNLNNYDKGLMALKLQEILKIKGKENMSKAGEGSPILGKVDSEKTAAETFNVSKGTLNKVKQVEEKGTVEQKKELKTGVTTVNKVFNDIKKAELKKKREQLKEQNREPKDSKKSEIVFFNCDCFEFLKATKDNTVDCIITDPPYSVTDNSWDNFKSEAAFLKFIDKVLTECKRVLKLNYAFFMFMDSRLMSKVEELIIKNKFDLKSRIIWVRKNMSMGRVVKDRFISQWEICFYCGNKELNFPEVWGEERGDVQSAAVPQTNYEDKKIHPTQKPLKLVERFIELSTNQGDIVIDPFCGGGTTAAACYNLGRNCFTSDISKEYIDNAKERIFGRQLLTTYANA